MDPTEFGAGSAPIDVSYAVRQSGGHDLWDVPSVQDIVPDGLETVQKRTIKVRCGYVRVMNEAYLCDDRNPILGIRET